MPRYRSSLLPLHLLCIINIVIIVVLTRELITKISFFMPWLLHISLIALTLSHFCHQTRNENQIKITKCFSDFVGLCWACSSSQEDSLERSHMETTIKWYQENRKNQDNIFAFSVWMTEWRWGKAYIFAGSSSMTKYYESEWGINYKYFKVHWFFLVNFNYEFNAKKKKKNS